MARRRWRFTQAPLEHAFIRFLDDRWRSWFTPLGRVWFVCLLVTALMLFGGLARPVLALFSMLLTTGLGALLAMPLFRPRVEVERHLSAWPSAGETFRYTVTVTNPGSTPIDSLVFDERRLPAELRPEGVPPQLASLEPGESARVTLSLRCPQRGAYRLPELQVASSAPFGLLKARRRSAQGSLLYVLPRFSPLSRLQVPLSRSHQPTGLPAAAAVGDSSELAGTRDFRPGDRLRDVHWAALARTGRWVVKEWQEEFFVRVAMVVDLEERSAADEQQLERGISQAAALCDALARRDHVVDLFCAGAQLVRKRVGRALGDVEDLLELLASLEGDEHVDFEALAAAIEPEASRLSAVLLVLGRWDAPRQAFVQRLVGLGLAARVLVIDPVTAAEVPPELRLEAA